MAWEQEIDINMPLHFKNKETKKDESLGCVWREAVLHTGPWNFTSKFVFISIILS